MLSSLVLILYSCEPLEKDKGIVDSSDYDRLEPIAMGISTPPASVRAEGEVFYLYLFGTLSTSWTATADNPWIYVAPSSGYHEGWTTNIITVMVNTNYSTEPRSGKVVFQYDDSSLIITIDQEQRPSQEKRVPTYGMWIDLGLSTMWAGWNVGANAPEETGNYYAWGSSKSIVSNPSYEHCDPSTMDYRDLGKVISGTEYDTAGNLWGNGSIMPTKEHFEELMNMCRWEEHEYGRTAGYLITGPNGNSIFLPFGTVHGNPSPGVRYGSYWTATANLDSKYPATHKNYTVHALECSKERGKFIFPQVRDAALLVRPVREK